MSERRFLNERRTGRCVRTLRLVALAALLTTATAQARDLSFTDLPTVGDTISPQRDLFICQTVTGARYMSDTGFLSADCRRMTQNNAWTVVACTRQTLEHGDWWLIEVTGASGNTAWIPLPWHDWA